MFKVYYIADRGQRVHVASFALRHQAERHAAKLREHFDGDYIVV